MLAGSWLSEISLRGFDLGGWNGKGRSWCVVGGRLVLDDRL